MHRLTSQPDYTGRPVHIRERMLERELFLVVNKAEEVLAYMGIYGGGSYFESFVCCLYVEDC